MTGKNDKYDTPKQPSRMWQPGENNSYNRWSRYWDKYFTFSPEPSFFYGRKIGCTDPTDELEKG